MGLGLGMGDFFLSDNVLNEDNFMDFLPSSSAADADADDHAAGAGAGLGDAGGQAGGGDASGQLPLTMDALFGGTGLAMAQDHDIADDL